MLYDRPLVPWSASPLVPLAVSRGAAISDSLGFQSEETDNKKGLSAERRHMALLAWFAIYRDSSGWHPKLSNVIAPRLKTRPAIDGFSSGPYDFSY